MHAATSEDSKSLQKIHSTVSDVLQTFKTLNINTEQSDLFIVFLVRSKLPNKTLSLWEQSLKNNRELVKWAQLEEFLIDRFEAVDRISSMRDIKERMSLPNTLKPKIQQHASQEKSNNGCKVCNGDHNLRLLRIDFARTNGICNNCLSQDHFREKCPSKNTCFICKMNHHTLLHIVTPSNAQNTSRYTQPPIFNSSNSKQMKNESQAKSRDGFTIYTELKKSIK